jgi:peptide chain release factor 2
LKIYGGHFDFDGKCERLTEVERELAQNDIWNKPEQAQELNKERAQLERVVSSLKDLGQRTEEHQELLGFIETEQDESLLAELQNEVAKIETSVARLEFERMFANPMDPNNAYVDIQAGSGGTEAQDWAEMILRMYMRFCESKGFRVSLEECSSGEVAGIKSATIYVQGEYAYGWLRTETGVHRLVRKSPFDTNNKRHTSFASVFVSPEVDETIEIAINPAEIRVDTYRASGAGGQHVNKTDSAIRITHIPTNIVVQCQSERSQHTNRDKAFKQLKAKLYEMEMLKRREAQQKLEESKMDIGWGSQIRSYVLDQSRIKDLRTNIERTDTQKVLDGDLTEFIEASLKEGL